MSKSRKQQSFNTNFYKSQIKLDVLFKQANNLCCAARGHALAVWLRLVSRQPNALRPGATEINDLFKRSHRKLKNLHI